ncbi:MAG: carboxypeptidase-like regulatory domain-containing protein [Aestuariibaculum sp.]
MKRLFLFTVLFFVVSVVVSQNAGFIVGTVIDEEIDNDPLVFANISLKNTNVEVQTDETGLFTINNLETGNYTIVLSFAGYETKEIDIKVDGLTPVELKLSLGATSVSVDDIAALVNIEQEETQKPSE